MALWRVRADVLDVPGRLAALAAAVGMGGGNVLAFEVHTRSAGTVTDEVVVDLPPADTPARLARRLHTAGADAVRAVPADAHELVDLPTSLVDAVARLAVDPNTLPAALALAARADEVRLASAPAPASPHALAIELGGGRVAMLRRSWAPFTTTEAARARAVARIAVVLSALPPKRHWLVALPDGQEALIRTARPDDAAAVSALQARSAGASELSTAVLAALAGEQPGATVLVAVSEHEVVGVGLVAAFGTATIAEVGVVVADAVRGRGVGTALLRRLASVARDHGVRELLAVTRADNSGAHRAWRRAGLDGDARRDGEIVELWADLTALPLRGPEQLP